MLIEKQTAPAELALRRPGAKGGDPMATTKDSVLAHELVARRRLFSALKEADERHSHELMDEEQRLLLAERIVRLKTRLARTAIAEVAFVATTYILLVI